MSGPSAIEITWTAVAFVLFLLSVSQIFIALGDWRAKAQQARVRNGHAKAGEKLALYLAITIMLDTLVLLLWTVAGSLSIVRHYLEAVEDLPENTLAYLLFVALFAFAARVVVRAYSRIIVNRL